MLIDFQEPSQGSSTGPGQLHISLTTRSYSFYFHVANSKYLFGITRDFEAIRTSIYKVCRLSNCIQNVGLKLLESSEIRYSWAKPREQEQEEEGDWV